MSWLIERLRNFEEDRGMMANLRCLLVKNKVHKGWPALNRVGVKIENQEQGFISGLFALHPKVTGKGNLGETCKAIELARGDNRGEDSRLTPTERRFQHLLSAEKKELMDRVLRIILLAKAHGIPINYEQLESDIRYWGDRVKIKWASSFWSQPDIDSSEEEV